MGTLNNKIFLQYAIIALYNLEYELGQGALDKYNFSYIRSIVKGNVDKTDYNREARLKDGLKYVNMIKKDYNEAIINKSCYMLTKFFINALLSIHEQDLAFNNSCPNTDNSSDYWVHKMNMIELLKKGIYSDVEWRIVEEAHNDKE